MTGIEPWTAKTDLRTFVLPTFLRSRFLALPAAVFIIFAFASGYAPIAKISPDGEFLSFVLPKERNQRKCASRFRSTALALNSFSWSEG
jgi:hypothetical protein